MQIDRGLPPLKFFTVNPQHSRKKAWPSSPGAQSPLGSGLGLPFRPYVLPFEAPTTRLTWVFHPSRCLIPRVLQDRVRPSLSESLPVVPVRPQPRRAPSSGCPPGSRVCLSPVALVAKDSGCLSASADKKQTPQGQGLAFYLLYPGHLVEIFRLGRLFRNTQGSLDWDTFNLWKKVPKRCFVLFLFFNLASGLFPGRYKFKFCVFF